MSNELYIENLGKTLIVRFCRPEIRNRLSISVLLQLLDIAESCAKNDEIDTIIFTGTASVFAAGADLREIADVVPERAAEFALRGQHLMNNIAASTKTTIAAINGFCCGGALDLALACDRRIASPAATFSHPGTGLGIITGWGGTQRLPRLVGTADALEMFFTARNINAAEALRIGLIDEISSNPLETAVESASI